MSHEGNDLILENYYEDFLDKNIGRFDKPLLEHLANEYAKWMFFNGPHGDHEND